MGEGGGLNRKRKTPAELAAEAEAEDQDEFTSKYDDFTQMFLFR